MKNTINMMTVNLTKSILTLTLCAGLVSTSCPDGWVTFNGSCYLFSHEAVDYLEAQQYCRHHGAHLVHVNSAKENTFLKTFLGEVKTTQHWMGLTDEQTESVWLWSDTNTTATFTDWQSGQPNAGSGGNCAIFWKNYAFRWADEKCSATYQPICEINVADTSCPDGYVSFSDSCYLFLVDKVHFTKAEELCRNHGSHLVHVGDALENTFIKSFLRDLKGATHWLGLSDGVIEGLWKWYDTDTTAEFTDWSPGEPNQGRVADCAAFYASADFKWVDEPCSDHNYEPVCELIKKSNQNEIVG